MIPLVKILFVTINFSLLTFVVSLMIDHYLSGHSLLSFGTAFHALTLLWLIIRGLFWILTVVGTTEMSMWLFYALYWMPVPIEFGSFMLLPLFFTQGKLTREYALKLPPSLKHLSNTPTSPSFSVVSDGMEEILELYSFRIHFHVVWVDRLSSTMDFIDSVANATGKGRM